MWSKGWMNQRQLQISYVSVNVDLIAENVTEDKNEIMIRVKDCALDSSTLKVLINRGGDAY